MSYNNQARATLTLDKRRAKKDGTFPVKLYVWHATQKKGKHYPTGLSCSLKEYESAQLKSKVRKPYLELRSQFNSILERASSEINQLTVFSFSEFEKRMGRSKNNGTGVFFYYNEIISEYSRSERLKTASNYEMSRNSIQGYLKHTGKDGESLGFTEITVDWLQGFENYLTTVRTKGKSKATLSTTTFSMYCRCLRAVYNRAIRKNEVQQHYYPFGLRRNGKFQILAPKKVKKALDKEQIRTLYMSEPSSREQQWARDFFLFSYVCNGMNTKDIALLKHAELRQNSFRFFRAKIRNTNAAPMEIIVHLNEFAKKVIENYAVSSGKSSYVFPILTDGMSESDRMKAIHNFTSSINKPLKKLTKKLGLPPDISSNWARHSFATHAANDNMGVDFIRQSMGHSSNDTAINYIGSLDGLKRKEFSESLLNFED